MARPDKVAAVEEVREGLTGAAATLLTHYRGLSVSEMSELRASLRAANAQMRIVKNTLARRGAEAAGMEELHDLFSGPIGLVFCEEDPVGPAKALKAFQKDHPELVIRGGYLDGEILDEDQALALADLASREELLAKLAGLMDGALSNTARLLQAATEKQARLMAALVDAGGPEAKGFAPAAGTAGEAEAPRASDAPADEATDESDAPAESDTPAESDVPAESDAPGADTADEAEAPKASAEPAGDDGDAPAATDAEAEREDT